MPDLGSGGGIDVLLSARRVGPTGKAGSPQTIKQHLASIKMLFDYRVVSQIVPVNPPAPVKGPTHVVKRGKTTVLSVEDAGTLLDSIPLDSLQGLRDRALIGVMLFSFARVSAVLGMRVSDFDENGRRRWERKLEGAARKVSNALTPNVLPTLPK